MLNYKDESDLLQRARVAAKHNTNFWHTETETEALWRDKQVEWNRGGGGVLHQLETREASWKQSPRALSGSFVEELEHRLNEIRCGRLQSIRRADRKTSWYSTDPPHDSEITSPDHLVFFSDSLATDGEFEEVEDGGEYEDSRHQYIDRDCTMEEVTLLREIAAQWKRDQWQAISTRFNGMTGRKITPEQAKSILDNHKGSNIHRMESSRPDGNRDRIRTKARPVHSVEWQLQR
ncbi:hypothetical protein CNMCM8980_005905 [Aspergillus fumigatiaffinis]|uniref:Myb-like domain-containing protein n=1 Tax=Aspergillus fumigatiaffinis TaxID=340414 RepID=A0A8H4GRC9_9EURO|nr:hypothetical protein CNMCM5878_004022 [Aspergillus fumigatiaffinis]KAF4216330.1 hypothetical protein CNMCM6457_005179 [Aspergillus fumigatiaffinis]KAF4226961.1 hypothetical protein CNMCM6805_003780 [Aspergillus fumigatiaffinis]KAF4230211.1 hypothetical protein CNMCM8980_005905 [Aspergillus fumigatiaffinis]